MNFTKLDRLLDTMPLRGIPGCDLAVTLHGETVYRHQAGVAHRETGAPVDETTMWRIYSASKLSTCTAAMQLVEQGKLRLEDKVSDYLPAFADLTVKTVDGVRPCTTPMRVIHLFTMTGGLDYDMQFPPYKAAFDAGKGTAEVLSQLVQKPLRSEPGALFFYSLCHDVLGCVIEAVSGEKLSQYLQRHIYEPLGMENTTLHPTDAQRARLADLYTFDHTTGTAVPDEGWNYDANPNFESGGAGVFSTVGDYSKLMTALSLGGTSPDGAQILRQETVAMMEEDRLTSSCRADVLWRDRLHGYSWGLCGRVHINPDYSLSRSSVGEFGWDGAAAAFALADRKKELAMYFGAHVMNCTYAYHVLHPLMRDLVYEAIEG